MLRDNPDTLQGIATNEQILKARMALTYTGRHETPTEVDHSRNRNYVRPQKRSQIRRVNTIKCWRCGQEGHLLKDCRVQNVTRPSAGHGRSRNRNK